MFAVKVDPEADHEAQEREGEKNETEKVNLLVVKKTRIEDQRFEYYQRKYSFTTCHT